jgi:hypothetical protein
MRQLFFAANGTAPTTAAMAKVATGTAIKTLLQIAPNTRELYVVEWGISFDGSTAATPVACELLETDVAATVTAHVAAGVQPYNNNRSAAASTVTLGTAATGYTATVEGSTTVSRFGDIQLVAPTNQYLKQWPMGNEFVVGAGKFLRVRVTAPATVNAWCYVIWTE